MKASRRNARRMGLGALALAAPCSGERSLSRSARAPSSCPIRLARPPSRSRALQARLPAGMGQPVVIEDRAGAGGSIGAAYVANSAPDGYRILLTTQPIITIRPHLRKDMGFDPLEDLTPLTNGVNAPVAIAVSSTVPAQNLAGFVAWGRRNPGALTFGTAGAGSPQHVGGMLPAQRTQIDMTHVPYKGGGRLPSKRPAHDCASSKMACRSRSTRCAAPPTASSTPRWTSPRGPALLRLTCGASKWPWARARPPWRGIAVRATRWRPSKAWNSRCPARSPQAPPDSPN
jgi:hypothetical protein